jgi:RNA polymerase sigma factor (sigma-70 family)
MPPFDPKTKDTPRTLHTTGGVEVIVKPPPLPPRVVEPRELEGRTSRTIIVPEGQTDEERRAFLNDLCREHVQLVEELLERRKDVLAESRKDLRQRVLLVLCHHVEDTRRVPENMRAWLDSVVRREVKNHKDLWKPPVLEGADAETVPACLEEQPEGAADLAERRAKLERCLDLMPGDQAAVIRCTQLFDMTLEETATAMGKPASTVFDLSQKAGEKVARLMRALTGGASPASATKNENT